MRGGTRAGSSAGRAYPPPLVVYPPPVPGALDAVTAPLPAVPAPPTTELPRVVVHPVTVRVPTLELPRQTAPRPRQEMTR